MSRKPAPLRPRKCTRNGQVRYEVRVPDELMRAEGHKRRFFDKESVATAYANRLKGDLTRYSDKARGLSDAQKIEAQEAFARLTPFPGASLTTAVDRYVAQLDQAGRSFRVSELAAKVIADKQAQRGRGNSESLLEDIRLRCARFAETFGERMVSEITPEEARQWLLDLKKRVQAKGGGVHDARVETDEPVSQKTRRLYKITLSLCFSWAVERGAAAANPFKAFRLAVPDKKRVFIFTPAQAAALLRVAEPRLRPYLALCLFAGLRPEHAQGVKGFTWELIHFDRGAGGEIEVPASTDKTEGERIVPIQPNLRAWLLATPAAERRGKLFYSVKGRRLAYARLRAEFPALPATWPQDGPRHSFGTYRVKTTGSFGTVAQEMGNSESVVRDKYYRSISAGDAVAYWNIHPEGQGT